METPERFPGTERMGREPHSTAVSRRCLYALQRRYTVIYSYKGNWPGLHDVLKSDHKGGAGPAQPSTVERAAESPQRTECEEPLN
jgi:hypothetical protein